VVIEVRVDGRYANAVAVTGQAWSRIAMLVPHGRSHAYHQVELRTSAGAAIETGEFGVAR
jgi:hypothetical protein